LFLSEQSFLSERFALKVCKLYTQWPIKLKFRLLLLRRKQPATAATAAAAAAATAATATAATATAATNGRS